MQRYKFDRTDRGFYYCYFGCSLFGTASELVKHLVDEHPYQLQAWGMCRESIGAPSLASPMNEIPNSNCHLLSVLTNLAEKNQEFAIREKIEVVTTVDQCGFLIYIYPWFILGRRPMLANKILHTFLFVQKWRKKLPCVPPEARIEYVKDEYVAIGFKLSKGMTLD